MNSARMGTELEWLVADRWAVRIDHVAVGYMDGKPGGGTMVRCTVARDGTQREYAAVELAEAVHLAYTAVKSGDVRPTDDPRLF